MISAKRSECLGMLFSCLHYEIGLPDSVAGMLVEEIFTEIMNGKSLPEILELLYEMLDSFGIKAGLAARCVIWQIISRLMLEIELPMLKGRSRNRYGEEKKISPWTVAMSDKASAKMKSDSKTTEMREFPVEIQEMMYEACSFADDGAIKHLMQYRKKEKIQSEEFLLLLVSAQITGCQFEQASEILKELERGSKQARKAASALRMRLEPGENVMDESLELIDESWDFMEPLQKPYVREERKIGRNEPCPCGSGKKYKHCCGK